MASKHTMAKVSIASPIEGVKNQRAFLAFKNKLIIAFNGRFPVRRFFCNFGIG
jgi:hypothetical protein